MKSRETRKADDSIIVGGPSSQMQMQMQMQKKKQEGKRDMI